MAKKSEIWTQKKNSPFNSSENENSTKENFEEKSKEGKINNVFFNSVNF